MGRSRPGAVTGAVTVTRTGAVTPVIAVTVAVRVREAMPRADNECEKCEGNAIKRCSGCRLVYYCSTACQKQDWKFHKVTCQKNKKN